MKHFSYQGKVKKNGFEGWYTRFTDPIKGVNMAIIMALTTFEEDPHAFIQVFDGQQKTNQYFRFPLDQFQVSDDFIKIESSILSKDQLRLDLKAIQIDLTFKDHQDNPYKSAMGFLEKMPLETFQEVVTLVSDFEGVIHLKNEPISISGRSYMEKTYGRKFPKEWFWLQANHFREESLSFSLSGGHVPTLKFRPFGFFILIYFNQKTYRFATYNFAKLNYKQTLDATEFIIKKGRYTVILTVSNHEPTELVGPLDKGEMTLPVYESISSTVTFVLKDKETTLIRDTSPYAGFEYMMKG
jgi:hypothetical protein